MRAEPDGPQHMDGEGSPVNLKNSLQLTMIYQTIYKTPFQEEEKPNETLTKSASKDYISEIDGWRDAGLCLKIKSVSERIFHCKLISSAPVCAALLVSTWE